MAIGKDKWMNCRILERVPEENYQSQLVNCPVFVIDIFDKESYRIWESGKLKNGVTIRTR